MSVGRSLVALALVGILAGCGATPEPTEPPPTQTPWIVIITATPGTGDVAQALPTQTPWIIVATPTMPRRATPSPTALAVVRPEATRPGTPLATAEASEAAPSETPRPPTATPTPTPEPATLVYPPPVLREPPPGQRVAWRATVLLQWNPVGGLGGDEYYRLDLYRPPASQGMGPYGDYRYLKEPECLLEGSFIAPFHPPEVQGEAVVYWWVRVVRQTGEDQNGKPVGVDLSPPSEQMTLILEPKPEDA